MRDGVNAPISQNPHTAFEYIALYSLRYRVIREQSIGTDRCAISRLQNGAAPLQIDAP